MDIPARALFHGCWDPERVRQIEEDGVLKPGEDGFVWLTTDIAEAARYAGYRGFFVPGKGKVFVVSRRHVRQAKRGRGLLWWLDAPGRIFLSERPVPVEVSFRPSEILSHRSCEV
ncbi:MAG: hypothetical protein HYY99_01780 [Candidatus Colwellbacteria bacterium]|nr:hypothetical protein [Candidatus Colwellbacteria bacterium]